MGADLDDVCAGNPKAQEELKQLRIERAAYEGRMVQAEQEVKRLQGERDTFDLAIGRLLNQSIESKTDKMFADEWKRRYEGAKAEIERLKHDVKKLLVASDEQEKDLDEWKRRAELLRAIVLDNMAVFDGEDQRAASWADVVKEYLEVAGWFKNEDKR